MPAASGRGRPRRASIDAAIREATLTLVREGGPAAATMEAVATRAGVAKTTLYRRHPDRSALLEAVLAHAIGSPTQPPDGDVRTKIRWALGEAWRQMGDVLGTGGLSAVIADSDPTFTAAFRRTLAPYDAALAALIEQDVADGALRPDLDADGAVTLFIGAYVGGLIRHGDVAHDWLERCLDLMWVAMTGQAAD